MQPGSQVRRLSDHLVLLGSFGFDEVADHDDPGGDADAHLQRSAGGGLELGHRLDQREPGTHGAFGIVLVGLGIAEIDQYAIAHVPSDETSGLDDEIGAATVVRTDDPLHVLGVEPGRERGRTNEVAEHDREMAALGVGPWGGRRGLRRSGRLFTGTERSNGPQ